MTKVSIITGESDAGISEWIAHRLTAALAATEGPIAITVPGGSTPFPILEKLVAMPLDWRRLTVWPNDDRVVPEDHPASNVGRIRRLLGPAGAEVVTLTTMEQVPPFALAWLGMGADGHVASLFASSDPRVDDPEAIRRIRPEPLPPEAPFERVSLTIPSLLNSDRVMFVIRGQEKRAVFEAAAAGTSDLPVARLLGAATQDVSCFV
jgi:6-phosphogluconolactonase